MFFYQKKHLFDRDDVIDKSIQFFWSNGFSGSSMQRVVKATSLMLHVFGMRVYGYRNDSSNRMREGLIEGMPWLPWGQGK